MTAPAWMADAACADANLLTGEPSPDGQWRVRNVVAWCRPNPPVGALGDKFRPATSYLTIATRNPKRYFDLDAVRTPPKSGNEPGRPGGSTTGYRGITDGGERIPLESHPAGAPPLDYWVIPPQPYSGSHHAVYAPALCEIPIDTMVPHRVCTTCGLPSTRIVETDSTGQNIRKPGHPDDASKQVGAVASTHVPDVAHRTTVGWTDCGHDTWRTGVVLDPFAGTGTTLMVATGHGRDAIGIDIDERNAALALDRVGPLLLTVEHHDPEAAA